MKSEKTPSDDETEFIYDTVPDKLQKQLSMSKQKIKEAQVIENLSLARQVEPVWLEQRIADSDHQADRVARAQAQAAAPTLVGRLGNSFKL